MSTAKPSRKKSPWLENFAESGGFHQLRRVVCVDDVGDATEIFVSCDPFADVIPVAGGFRNVAVFGDEVPGKRNTYGSYQDDYITRLTFDIMQADLTKENELLRMLETYGCFTRDFDRSSGWRIEDKAYELFGDNTMGRVRRLEPLWWFAQEIALYRLTRQILTSLRNNAGRSVKSITRVVQYQDREIEQPLRETRSAPLMLPQDPTDSPRFRAQVSNGPKTRWRLQFEPRWMPIEVRQGLDYRLMVFFDDEPKTSEHFLAAGWTFVQKRLNEVFSSGFRVEVMPYMPQSLRQAGRSLLPSNRPKHVSFFSDSREGRPPMFALKYQVHSLCESLYLALLDEAMRGSYQKPCAICGELFEPPSGKFKYCDHHDEAEQKRWRRLRRANATPKDDA